jgi:threonine synthase
MWKVFGELAGAGWIDQRARLPRMITAQASGCAPIVRAFEAGEQRATPWANPTTHASGLRVPAPLGDRLILRALRESGGDAVAVGEEDIRENTRALALASGIDVCPEGGCALGVLRELVRRGRVGDGDEVVIFNTGSGAGYRA